MFLYFHIIFQVIRGDSVENLRLARAGEKPSTDYVPCPGCFRWFLSTQLGRHGKKCICVEPGQDINVHAAKIVKNALPQLTESAQAIVGEMSTDDIGKSMRGDDVLLDFANSIGETLNDLQDQQQVKVLRGRMRLLGRFLKHGQTLYPGVTMKNLLKNTEFVKIKEICQSVPVVTGTTKRTHMLIGFELKHVIERQLFLLKTKPVSDERDNDIKSLEFLSDAMGKPWSSSVNSAVAHNVAETNRNKRKTLCKEEDVKKVFRYTVEVMQEYRRKFEESKTSVTYRNLLEAVFSWITSFNFR